MSLDDTRDLESELVAAIGQDRLIALAEKIGGFRFYVPQNPAMSFDKYRIGEETLTTLASLYGGEYIIIPLAKQLRAQKMWADGASYADIARALVMTESGVFRLLKRKPRPLRKRKVDTRQMNLL
jgi:Mor family transcriptional regulator